MNKSTFRRKLLDESLENSRPYMKGRVLDIGGKRANPRGTFSPPEESVNHWFYLNIDKNTNPDLLANSENIPVKNNSIDTVILCEVLEHVENPYIVIHEVNRILKTDGHLILSMPFLYRIHPDPHDFQRYTDTKLKNILEKSKFVIIELKKNGYFYSVLADFIFMAIIHIKNRVIRGISIVVYTFFSKWMIKKDEVVKDDFYKSFTTGFFIIAKKI